MVLDKDVETTVHKQDVICRIRPLNSSNCYDIWCLARSFIDCKVFFYTNKRVARSLCHSTASCQIRVPTSSNLRWWYNSVKAVFHDADSDSPDTPTSLRPARAIFSRESSQGRRCRGMRPLGVISVTVGSRSTEQLTLDAN